MHKEDRHLTNYSMCLALNKLWDSFMMETLQPFKEWYFH